MAERGWWSGLLDQFAVTPDAVKGGLLGILEQNDVAARKRRQEAELAALQRGETIDPSGGVSAGQRALDLSPVAPFVEAYKGAEKADKGEAPYDRGSGVGQFVKNVAMAFVPGSKAASKVRKAETVAKVAGDFETKAPRGGYKSDLSKTSYPTSVDDMTFARQPNGLMVPQKVIDPASLQGSLLMPAVGDRTIAGQTLTGINGQPLAFPVDLQGGPNFMRGPQQVADNAFWASNPGPNTRMAKDINTQLETGKPVNLVYTAMGGKSGDFSHMMADTMLAQMPNATITKTAKRAFDQEMRKTHPDWPGLDSADLRTALATNGPMRKDMVQTMALDDWRKKGFPEVAASRAAITEPDLLRQTGAGATGLTVARVTDPKVIDSPSVPHGTYPSQIGGGTYVGGFPEQVPRSLVWPAAHAQMEKEGLNPRTQYDYTFQKRQPVQLADQQWLDGIMKWLNR